VGRDVDLLTATELKKPKNVLYVMRHGKTILDNEDRSDGWLDYPLSDEGRLGLIDAQQFLKHAPIKTTVTNSLRRVAETAHIINSGILSHPGTEIDEDTRTWNLGELIGTIKQSARPIVEYYVANPGEKPKGGESLSKFQKRFMTSVNKLLARVKRGDGPILLVCSGSNIRTISVALCGDPHTYNLTEAGVLMLVPFGKKIHCKIVFGHVDDEESS
jgi:broad specificity phosphatase PhoE